MNENSPISQNKRTPIVDVLRGWALFSVVVMNYSTIFGWNNRANKTPPDQVTDFIETFTEILLGSKGWTLLAVLFGFGFSVLLKNISQSGQSVYVFFTRRMLWLFAFAVVNTIFFGGDILTDYALMGLLLLLFYQFNTRTLFVMGITILLLTPLLQSYLGRLHLLFAPKDRDAFFELYNQNNLVDHIKANFYMRYKWMLRLSYSIILHLIQLGCFLIGVGLHRSNFFGQLTDYKKQLKFTCWISLFFSISIYILQLCIEQQEWTFNKFYNLYYPQILSIMAFTSTGIVLLYKSGKCKSIFSALQVIGKMTLTNYMMQNIIAFFLFINLKPGWPLHWYLIAGVGLYMLQIGFSKWWLHKYNYGPVEWLWRCLSYGRMFPLKKTATHDERKSAQQ